MHSPRIFELADGRTERVSTTIIILKYVKTKSVLHNGGCVEKETNYHFNCVIRLGTFRLVRADNVFLRFFFPYTWSGQWNDRPLGSCDTNSPLEKLVREVIKMPLGLQFALCVSTNFVLFSIVGNRLPTMEAGKPISLLPGKWKQGFDEARLR